MSEIRNEIQETVGSNADKGKLSDGQSLPNKVNVGLSGDPLNPFQILRSGGNTQEKQQKLTEFKDRLSENKEAMVGVLDDLTRGISENPDMRRDELMQLLENTANLSQLTPYQIEALKVGLRGYEVKHKFIHKIRVDYPNDTDLFEAAFKRKPKGKVAVIEGPINLYFRCYEPEDYATLRWGIFSAETDPNEAQIQEAERSGGVFLGSERPHIPALIESVTVENAHGRDASDITRRTMLHEEQHAIWQFFKRVGETAYRLGSEDTPSSVRWKQETVAKAGAALWNEASVKEWSTKLESLDDLHKGKYLAQLLRNFRIVAGEERAGDEFLAFLRGGRSPNEALRILTTTEENGGLYDYFSNTWKRYWIEPLKNSLPQDLQPILDRSVGLVFGEEYKKALESGSKALVILRNAGYPDNKIIALLMLEPLRKWEKTVRRLLKSKGLMPVDLEVRNINSLHQEDINENSPRMRLRYNDNKTPEEAKELENLEKRYAERKKLIALLYKTGRLVSDYDYYQAAVIMFHYGSSMEEYKFGEEMVKKAGELTPDEKTRVFYQKVLERWKESYMDSIGA